jgi:hypothetical protein
MQWFRAFVRSWWYHDEFSFFVALFALVTSSFRSRVALQAEILGLRHQLAVFQKNAPRRCASGAPTGFCGSCCHDGGPVGAGVYTSFAPIQ